MAGTELPLTPRTRRTLHEAARIAGEWGHAYVGTEHVMLALLADPAGIGGGAVHRLGRAEAVRAEIERILASDSYSGGAYYRA
jgi:ATP-dependent Clp protease ATP-binding subunit ClpC